MTTEAQIEANRSNAQKSTGPRTPEGKAKVAQNAVKHGLLARQATIVGEDCEEFDLFRNQMRAELGPAGLVESRLVERIVGLSWRLQRAEWFGTEAFDTLYVQRAVALQVVPEPPCGPDRGDPAFGGTVVKDFSETRVLERLLMYERRLEGSLYRSMAELRNLQALRKAARGVPGTGTGDACVAPTNLDNLLGAIATLEETPDGVTTNLPEAQSQSCETKPISPLRIEDGLAAGGPLLPATSDRCEPVVQTNPIGPGQSCETKPIPVGPGDGQSLCGIGVMSDPATSGLGETKPIPSGANRRQGGYVPIFRRRR